MHNSASQLKSFTKRENRLLTIVSSYQDNKDSSVSLKQQNDLSSQDSSTLLATTNKLSASGEYTKGAVFIAELVFGLLCEEEEEECLSHLVNQHFLHSSTFGSSNNQSVQNLVPAADDRALYCNRNKIIIIILFLKFHI